MVTAWRGRGDRSLAAAAPVTGTVWRPVFRHLALDALYAQTAVLQVAQQAGWDVVISLKQNSRDLYQSAVRLFARRSADTSFTEHQDHKIYRVQLWDTEGLPFTIDNPEPVRVVRSEEVLERNRFRQDQRVSLTTDHEWLWITTLPQALFPATTFDNWGTAAGNKRTTAGWI
jgi:hypothetical protein